MQWRVLESSEQNVWKYVFTADDMVAEAVLYRYNSFMDRTVICCSVQSGCPVGCSFCGTGKKFIRNLTTSEIVAQVVTILTDRGIFFDMAEKRCKKFQIMFMSMGEPALNWDNVREAIVELDKMFPNAQLLISTVGIADKQVLLSMESLSHDIKGLGLQFSIHRSTDKLRNEIIPFKNKLTLREIRDEGIRWWNVTGRKPYLNYCIDGTNNSDADFIRLADMFSPEVFCFTFSVVCDPDPDSIGGTLRFDDLEKINAFKKKFDALGYNTRIFDPAGQDDIGGGCGQLWCVQDWLREHVGSNR